MKEPNPDRGHKEKQYRIRFNDGSTTDVMAEEISEPAFSSTPSELRFFVFKSGGDVVAKYKLNDVSGWKEIQHE